MVLSSSPSSFGPLSHRLTFPIAVQSINARQLKPQSHSFTMKAVSPLSEQTSALFLPLRKLGRVLTQKLPLENERFHSHLRFFLLSHLYQNWKNEKTLTNSKVPRRAFPEGWLPFRTMSSILQGNQGPPTSSKPAPSLVSEAVF